MTKSTLALAVTAAFAAGCSSTPHDEMQQSPAHASHVGPPGAAGMDGATGAPGDSLPGPAGNTGPGNRRAGSVCDALIQAGVPAYKIQSGSFGNPRERRDRRVEVLVSAR